MRKSIQCWQCGTRMTLDELASNDGDCPECEVEIHLGEYLSEALDTNQRLEAELAALKAAPAEPDEAVEVVAHMYQHDETGIVGFVDQQQVDWGFEKNNPRLHLIGPLMTVAQHKRILADIEANRDRQRQKEVSDAAAS